MSKYSNKYLWQKTRIDIDDINPINDIIIEIIISETGKPARIRRDMAEVFPGAVYIPLWLAQRLRGNKIDNF